MSDRSGVRVMIALLVACLAGSAACGRPDNARAERERPDVVTASPYLYLGWGDPPDPVQLMKATGTRTFTLAFILAGEGCTPRWDRDRPLRGGEDERAIERIRDAGGDVLVSVGGSRGPKLSEKCPDERALADAYQKVIDAYGLRAIDIDIEKEEFDDPVSQDKVLGALKIVNERRPEVRIVLTFPTLRTELSDEGKRLIQRTVDIGTRIDVFSIMPFEFGGQDMAQDTVAAMEGLRTSLQDILAVSPADAYSMAGLSTLNGGTAEKVHPEDFRMMLHYARTHDLGRLTFWSVNRDRPGPDGDEASGIPQRQWEFTRVLVGYQD